jgi:trk system potassium uptake protein TrkH
MGRLADLPLFVVLTALGAAAMLVPAGHAAAVGDGATAGAFARSALVCGTLSALLGLASLGHEVRSAARSHLLTLVGAFAVLPAMLAVPMAAAVPTTTFLNAWVEMVSSATTTGATLFDADRLPPSVHLWRALVGWMGGFLVWVAAIALLAPMNIGGFEVTSGMSPGAGARVDRLGGRRNAEEARARMLRHAGELAPVYAGLTLALWLGLVAAGEEGLAAACHAMAVLSTSGISPSGGIEGSGAGWAGEALIFLFLGFALSRATFDRGRNRLRRLAADRELAVAGFLIVTVPGMLFLRHWAGAWEVEVVADFDAALRALWGAAFTTLSFLTTTGFVSADWSAARTWAGLDTPGIVLVGLGLVGGGVATTAGGVKLMRVYALWRHGQRELDRLVYPSSVAGQGREARRIRGPGAYVAWIAFMLFALSLAAVGLLLTLFGAGFDEGIVLAVAALANCGPMADVVLADGGGIAALGDAAKGVLALAMVVGRLETLAILALFNPGFWRP